MKLLVQILAAVLAAVLPAFVGEGPINLTEWINVAILAIGGYQVWNAQNTNIWPIGKTLASVAMSVLVLLVSFVDGGLATGEIIQLVIAGLTPFGVYTVRNAGSTHRPIVNG